MLNMSFGGSGESQLMKPSTMPIKKGVVIIAIENRKASFSTLALG